MSIPPELLEIISSSLTLSGSARLTGTCKLLSDGAQREVIESGCRIGLREEMNQLFSRVKTSMISIPHFMMDVKGVVKDSELKKAKRTLDHLSIILLRFLLILNDEELKAFKASPPEALNHFGRVFPDLIILCERIKGVLGMPEQVRDYLLWCVSKDLVQEGRYPEATEIASMIFNQEHRNSILKGRSRDA